MKNRKLVLFVTGLLVLVLLFQLSFTYFSKNTEKKAKSLYTLRDVSGRDSVNAEGIKAYDNDAYSRHLDSISNTTVYNLGLVKFTYNECKSRELGLGLDLRGGMNMVLDVSKSKVLENLAGDYNSKQPVFKKSIADANKAAALEATDYVDLFKRFYIENSKGKPLAIAFMTNENKGSLSNKSTDEEVVNYLKKEIGGGIDRVYEVLETRLNQSTISQNTIQKLDGGRISVEIPGAENPKRIRKLITEPAALEFWEMYGNNPKNGFAATRKMFELDSFLSTLPRFKKDAIISEIDTATGLKIEKTDAVEDLLGGAVDIDGKKDTSKLVSDDIADNDTASADKDSAALAADNANRSTPLFDIMYPNIQGQQYAIGPAVGYVAKHNVKQLQELFDSKEVSDFLPADWSFAIDAKLDESGSYYVVYALRANKSGEARMAGDMIKNASADNDPTQGGIVVTMTMKPDAAEDWRRMTADNASNDEDKKYVAVVLDGKVYSAPGVTSEIAGGNTQISGNFDIKEAQDLANVLKAGKLPVPLQIIAEDVVGPTLGAQNISAGFRALLMGFIAIILFMIAYYHRAGFIADLAVIINVFFILGALASRGAALTLPGIAGLLLTIGMAVDANVLIYERIKEELRSGKTLKTSIQLGYKAAFSAILDANVTSLISGFILLSAGTGPVYGFAIILIIGIFSSLFTALLISRLIIEGRVARGKDIKFETSLSERVLRNPNWDFVNGRKKFYIISAVIVLIGAAALIGRGIPKGLDFEGGYSYTVQFDQTKVISAQEIKGEIAKLKSGSEVKKIGTDNKYKITTTFLINDNSEEATEKVRDTVLGLMSKFGVVDANILESARVGPTMAASTRNKSMIVTLISIFAMFYISYLDLETLVLVWVQRLHWCMMC